MTLFDNFDFLDFLWIFWIFFLDFFGFFLDFVDFLLIFFYLLNFLISLNFDFFLLLFSFSVFWRVCYQWGLLHLILNESTSSRPVPTAVLLLIPMVAEIYITFIIQNCRSRQLEEERFCLQYKARR